MKIMKSMEHYENHQDRENLKNMKTMEARDGSCQPGIQLVIPLPRILSHQSSAWHPQPKVLSQEFSVRSLQAGVFSQEFCEDSPVGILDQGSLARNPQSESTARGLQPATLSQKNPQAKVSSGEFSAGNPQSGILSQESWAKSPSHRLFVWEKNPWQQLTVTMT